MISPDKANMHRYEQGTPRASRPSTPGGRMTAEVLNGLITPAIGKADSIPKKHEKFLV
jgi:hypothetical protein